MITFRNLIRNGFDLGRTQVIFVNAQARDEGQNSLPWTAVVIYPSGKSQQIVPNFNNINPNVFRLLLVYLGMTKMYSSLLSRYQVLALGALKPHPDSSIYQMSSTR